MSLVCFMDGEYRVTLSPSRLEGTTWVGLCPTCGKSLGFVMEREVYRFEEIVPVGYCSRCERKFAVAFIDHPDNFQVGPDAAGSDGETTVRDLELGARVR